jgi:F-type H+-transporting ATPase subunit gamma
MRGRYIDHPVPYLFEPSARRVFEDLLPRWAIATFRLVMLETFTAEHGARMIAMKNATDNAQELLTSLTLTRNKVRQATITKELSEIVGTVEALK